MDKVLKRFLIFAGMEYYPGYGWENFIISLDTFEFTQDDCIKILRMVRDPSDISWICVKDITEEPHIFHLARRAPHKEYGFDDFEKQNTYYKEERTTMSNEEKIQLFVDAGFTITIQPHADTKMRVKVEKGTLMGLMDVLEYGSLNNVLDTLWTDAQNQL